MRPTNVGPTACHPDIMEAVLRMAYLYHERYPFILEWSNFHGKTALHVAALKGNEELVKVSYVSSIVDFIHMLFRCFVNVVQILTCLTI